MILFFSTIVVPGIGPYVEVAFFHKKSKTLLVTDAVIYVPDKPPEVVGKESLLDAAKNGLAVRILSAGREIPDDPIIDDEATRQRGNKTVVNDVDCNILIPLEFFSSIVAVVVYQLLWLS